MKVIYIKDFVGQSKGNVIDTDSGTVQFLIEKGVCELYVDISKEVKVKKVDTVDGTVEKPKRKGNPNWGKKQ